MPKIPGISHAQASAHSERPAFEVVRGREAHHQVRRRADFDHTEAQPINAFTMGGIAKDAGLTPDQFR